MISTILEKIKNIVDEIKLQGFFPTNIYMSHSFFEIVKNEIILEPNFPKSFHILFDVPVSITEKESRECKIGFSPYKVKGNGSD